MSLSRSVLEVGVRNDASAGISSRELDTGGDKLSLPLRYGRTARTVRITRILRQDAAYLILECQ